jgi:hypothetical protein
MAISVGTPVPQTQHVILDTGSYHTAFPCSDCDGCGDKLDPPFDDHESATGRPVPCGACENTDQNPRAASCKATSEGDRCVFSQTYAEGSSFAAVQFEDYVALGDLTLLLVFGCQVRESGLFSSQKVDGIMGLADHRHSLMSHVPSQESRLFSLCFTPTGGRFRIGGVRPESHEEPMRFAALNQVRAKGFYSLQVTDVRLNGVSLGTMGSFNAGKGVIVDSGTTDTYLPRSVAETFTRVWRDAVGHPHDHTKRAYSSEQFDALPVLVFYLKGEYGEIVEFAVHPSNYMDPGAARGEFTSRLYIEETEGAVLGANALNYHEVLFDASGGVVGFARSSCYQD